MDDSVSDDRAVVSMATKVVVVASELVVVSDKARWLIPRQWWLLYLWLNSTRAATDTLIGLKNT